MITLKGKNEQKVQLSGGHLKATIEAKVAISDLTLAGPAPAPLEKAENHYRYQIMIKTARMPLLSRQLNVILETLSLPDGVQAQVDIDPVNLH